MTSNYKMHVYPPEYPYPQKPVVPLCNPYPCGGYLTLAGTGMGRPSDTRGFTRAIH